MPESAWHKYKSVKYAIDLRSNKTKMWIYQPT